MFNNFGFIGSKILKEAEIERYNLHHPYVGSEHLLLAILKNSNLKEKLNEYSLNYKKFKEELISVVGIPKKNMEINLLHSEVLNVSPKAQYLYLHSFRTGMQIHIHLTTFIYSNY